MLYRLEAVINFGGQLGEPTVSWESLTGEEVDTMLNYLAEILNPMGVAWCSNKSRMFKAEREFLTVTARPEREFWEEICSGRASIMDLEWDITSGIHLGSDYASE